MRSTGPVVAFGVVALLLVGAYVARGTLRDAWSSWTAPQLPQEEAYHPSNNQPSATATDSGVVHASSLERTATPPAKKGTVAPPPTTAPSTLPTEKRLAVPFMSQAPKGDWSMPFEEACEESSVLMVRGYYQGKTGRYDPDEATKLIKDVVAFETSHYGFYQDTTATQTKRFLEAMFPELSAQVVPLTGGADQIKRLIAAGTPVIIPANGKTLPNPNFRNGGPTYHMLVVRGYTQDKFITNDPGTRLGENFLYTYDGLLKSVHDWNGGDVPHGPAVILVVKLK